MQKTKVIASCYASGEIIIGSVTPDNALEIARGSYETIMNVVEVCARHAYDGETLLVPGIPEAENLDTAFKAYETFKEMIQKRLQKGEK